MKNQSLCSTLTVLMSFGCVTFPVWAQELPPKNQSKVSQCNQIIEITNEAVSNANSISKSDPEQGNSLLRVANYMDSAVTKLEELSITDQTLKGYQSRFIKMYKETSQATRNFVDAYNRQNRSEAESAIQALQTATNPEKQLVADINNYCKKL
jgi:hypothetical protein